MIYQPGWWLSPTPLRNMMKVTWDDDIPFPTEWKVIYSSCSSHHQPATIPICGKYLARFFQPSRKGSRNSNRSCLSSEGTTVLNGEAIEMGITHMGMSPIQNRRLPVSSSEILSYLGKLDSIASKNFRVFYFQTKPHRSGYGIDP